MPEKTDSSAPPAGMPHGTAQSARRPRGTGRIRRRYRVLIGVVAALPLAALGTDYGVRAYSEAQTAHAFQKATGTATAPEVHIRGFPFLTQAARGTLDQVNVSAEQIPAGTDSPVPISRLDAHMTHLKRSSDADSAQAGSAEATAFVSYEDLSTTLGLDVRAGSAPGRITASLSVPIAGNIAVNAQVTKDGPTTIAFKVLGISSDQLPQSVLDSVSRTFEKKIPLQNLPHGMTLRSISTGSSGIGVTLSGHDVTFKTSEKSGTATDSGTSTNSGASGTSAA
ncbi:DUF2993 domain-containing protein [Streptomyces sp. NPDC093544]|uniref:LmeA family phospholipid-binding protein n=1 Tax=Streptomyces sp. NPDC093544 TaxID=3155200 RepID=UPI00341CBE22